MNNLRILPLILLCFGAFAIGLALCNIGAIIRKVQSKNTPTITHDTVYVLINTDTLYDNAVTADAIDSNCYSTYFEKIKDSVGIIR